MSQNSDTQGKDYSYDEPIHNWFGLTYASYLVIQRSVLQSLPIPLQRQFVKCLNEMEELTTNIQDELPTTFRVNVVDSQGKYTKDPYRDYNKGRRKVL